MCQRIKCPKDGQRNGNWGFHDGFVGVYVLVVKQAWKNGRARENFYLLYGDTKLVTTKI